MENDEGRDRFDESSLVVLFFGEPLLVSFEVAIFLLAAASDHLAEIERWGLRLNVR